MKVILAKEYGFCQGVRAALDKLDKVILEAGSLKKVYSIGEIIHNRDVIEHYRSQGVEIASSIQETEGGIGVVRAHGLPSSVIESAKANGYRIIDATCPFVRKITRIIEAEIPNGHPIYLIGEPDHPEVIAATHDHASYVTIVDYKTFNPADYSAGMKSCAIISQTTMSEIRFQEIVAHFKSICDHVHVHDTICPSTRKRQSSALETAKESDVMIILGGKNSSNTRRLYEICSQITDSYHIERIRELPPEALKGKKIAGVTAGASTPDWIVQEAIDFLSRQ